MLAELEAQLNQAQGKLDSAKQRLFDIQQKILTIGVRLISVEEAQQILQLVAQETQKNLVVHISDIVTMALDAVFEDDAYKFGIEFVQKRGRTEAELYFERDGNKIDPLTASGGGAVDVCSFALRIALWSLIGNTGTRISNTIILDEPFRFLSKDMQSRAAQMLKLLSTQLGIQFIFVTHIPELTEAADRVFNVKLKKQISTIGVGED